MTMAPHEFRMEANVPAVAQGATGDQIIGEAPFAGTLSSASYTPEANMTGHATDRRTFTIVNKGADGNGTTVMATLDLLAGVNPTDFNEEAFTLSAVAGATTVAAGDILAFVSTFVGAGIADPGGRVELVIARATAGA